MILDGTMLDVEVKTWGNSYGIRISKRVAERIGVQPGDVIQANFVRKSKRFDGFGLCKGAKPFRRDPDDAFRDF